MSGPRSVSTLARALLAESPRAVIRALVWMALVAGTEGIGLLLVVPVLALAGVPAGTARERAIAAFLGAEGTGREALIPVLVLGVALVVLRTFWMREESAASVALQLEVAGRRRVRLHRALLAMEWPAVLRERRDAWQHLLMVRVDEVQSSVLLLARLVLDGAVAGVMILLSLLAAPAMTGLVLLGVGVALLVRAGAGRGARERGAMLQRAGDALAAESGAQLAGLRMIRAAGAEGEATSRFTATLDRYHEATRAAAAVAVRDRGTWAVTAGVVLALVLWASVGAAGVAPSTLLLLIAVWGRLMPRLVALRTAARDLAETIPAWDAVDEAIARAEREVAPDVEFRAREGDVSAPMLVQPVGTGARAGGGATLEREIRVESLTFRWAPEAAPVFRDLTLSIAAHTLTVVTGVSGAGKSTLCDLLLGLVAPSGGRIVVDGAPLDATGRARWRRAVGYLAQEPVLLPGTVRENLRWTHPAATEAAMTEALRLAAADFVAALPQGLDTPIGDRGALLSGGERQRLALARALLGAPVLLILDEATSALDEATEQRILLTLRALRSRTTIVLVSHRAAARAAADATIAF